MAALREFRLDVWISTTCLMVGLAGCGNPVSNKETLEAWASRLPTAFHQDFKRPTNLRDQGNESAPLPEGLGYRNLDRPDHVRLTPEGLQLKVEKPFLIQGGRGIGIRTGFGLRGDFDAVMTFDNFNAEKASVPGNGVGFSYCVQVNDRPIFVMRRVRIDSEGVLWKNNGFLDTSEAAGRMRFARSGSTLSSYWAPGTQGGEFQLLEETDIGANDVQFLYLDISTNAQVKDVEMRVLDWHIRGHKELNPGKNDSAKISEPAPAASRTRLWIFLAVAALLLIALLAAWLYPRRRSPQPPSQSE
jgi:hypothetical protein